MFARYFITTLLAGSLAGIAHAEEDAAPDWNGTTLTGDWGGKRTELYNKGVTLEFDHKSDVMSNVSGGYRRGSNWMGETEARATFDLQKLLGWYKTTGYIHFHSQLGSRFNTNYAGTFMGVSNIEAPVNTAQFAHAWLQKSFADDSLEVLAGIYQVDSEFYVTETSGLFLQPPYGMANDLGQPNLVGANAAPIYPIGALAMRVKYTSPDKNVYLQAAVTDGVPGAPNNPAARGTQIRLDKGDGTLAIVEFGYTPQQSEPPFEAAKPGQLIEPELKVHEEHETFNKTAVGFWRYSARSNSQDPADTQFYSNRGMYLLAERSLMVEQGHPAQGLSGFVRFGTANKHVNQADWTASLGLRYHGLLERRDDDIAGIAVTVNHASPIYRTLNASTSSETQVEATYRAQITPWFALQPDLQYFIHPGMGGTDINGVVMKNVWVLGLRAEINF